jgi:WD40 repeat protein
VPDGVPVEVGSPVYAVAFSPDGALIATGTGDGRVRLWDRATHRELPYHFAGPGPSASISGVAFSPAGDLIVSGDRAGTVSFWSGHTGARVGSVPNDDTTVDSVAFSPTGDRVVVALMNGTVDVLAEPGVSPKVVKNFQADASVVGSAAFSQDPSGSRIVTGGNDNTVRVWDAHSFTQIGDPLVGHHGAVTSVAFNRDGTRIVSGGMDGSVREWDAATALPIPAGQGHEIRAVAFSPSGDVMASGGTDGTVKLWDAHTAAPIDQLGNSTPGYQDAVNGLAFSPDGRRIVTGGSDGSVRLWDLQLRRLVAELPMQYPPGVPPDPQGRRIKSVAFGRNGSLIAAAGYGGVLWLWDARDLKLLASAVADAHDDGKTMPYQIWSVAFNPNGDRLVTGSGRDHHGGDRNYLQQWTVDPLQQVDEPIKANPGWVLFSVAFSQDGTRIASGGYDGTVRLFDASNRSQIAVLASDQNPVLSIAFAHHMNWIATGGADGKVRLWKSDGDFQPIGTPLQGHESEVQSVAISPDDQQILSGSIDGTIHLWSAPQDLSEQICNKLAVNMSPQQWARWVSPTIPYRKLCPKLPDAPASRTSAR